MYQFSKNNESETHIWNETRKSHWLDICMTYLVGNFFDRSTLGSIYFEIRHLGAENHFSGLKWKSEMRWNSDWVIRKLFELMFQYFYFFIAS